MMFLISGCEYLVMHTSGVCFLEEIRLSDTHMCSSQEIHVQGMTFSHEWEQYTNYQKSHVEYEKKIFRFFDAGYRFLVLRTDNLVVQIFSFRYVPKIWLITFIFFFNFSLLGPYSKQDSQFSVAKMYRMRQLLVSFCKRATNYRALLRKMTYKDKTSYGSLPPCSQSSDVPDHINNVRSLPSSQISEF